MTRNAMHIGTAALREPQGEVRGEYVTVGSESFYRIAHYDRMAPFFISVVSASDHWLFISSEGGLTAGRQHAGRAIFPYYTEDKIHDNSGNTGSRTLLRVARGGKRLLWEPFDRRRDGLYAVSRNLYKNVCGNKLIFEEVHHDLELVFRTMWTTSDRFGLVKRSELLNTAAESVAVELLDGVENLLPWGVVEYFQNHYSCLGDAYKQNDLESGNALATYAFSSIPGDSAEPAEALRATVCWSTAPAAATRLLSSVQLDIFRRGGDVQTETRIRGRRGAYFIGERVELESGERSAWSIVADVDHGASEIAALRKFLAEEPDGERALGEDVDDGTRRLSAIVARADGLQATGDRLGSAHHFANVLFNVMRGGIFESAYAIPVGDFREYVRSFSREVWKRHESFLTQLEDSIDRSALLEACRDREDPALARLALAYLPLSFSRRHGDPSRPWNQFSINVKASDGSRVLDYQGNWRDIFQNWEALCLSFPEYFEGVIANFVNTTTADGYNPYRVTKQGYDWERPEPDEPWANLGYWGDHQLVYLLRLLEHSRTHHPGALERLLGERIFVYAEVPYDIAGYDALLDDPRASITYNTERERTIEGRVAALGFDGRYLPDANGAIHRVDLTEKLLVPLLAKVANLVPGGGFWMNTQRPEWNDANNALAGYGVSMVTLYHARRYVALCLELLGETAEAELSEEVADWLAGTARVLAEHAAVAAADDVDDTQRRTVVDALGRVAANYRAALYADGLSGRRRSAPLRAFLEGAQAFIEQAIRLNRRDDGLFHAYNVLGIEPGRMSLTRLDAMLEGQVAVLSSGALDGNEALALLEALRESALYRADQHSYLLYPDRELPRFVDKNTIPTESAARSSLFERLLADGNRELIERDVAGALHFNPAFRNIRDVRAALARLREQGYAELVDADGDVVAEIFETVFEHASFTGRSGTFYGYEGLGCIYWHMVSKLLLAVQECCVASRSDALIERYYDVRAGIGFNKSPDVYGAFPTDPYSHTPGDGGARQPGMTGQVKEEVITRLGELGLFVRDGRVRFDPLLLRASEFLRETQSFEYRDVAGKRRSLTLQAGELAFTYCQVPVLYRDAKEEGITLHHADGSTSALSGMQLDAETSAKLFARTGEIVRIDVALRPGLEGDG